MAAQDVRGSYDTVAENYAETVRAFATDHPAMVATFARFAAVAGPGPVLDAGCGPGGITAHLRRLGLRPYGMDLSPGMIRVARRDHPGVGFAVGDMARLPVRAATTAGLIAWYSLVHTPDEELAAVLAEFHRVLRPGAPLLLGFHPGEGSRWKSEGYGGLPMAVRVYRRRPEDLVQRLAAAGFTVLAAADDTIDARR
ncbi:class I SAM-dependent methyltransferase [Actinoplanes sp. N902-109]|uniref:class I SAM-dependent DNA methyltransferase n=1 Tax=Actinoplanes sp. (strain N902-109) TaxID=649831 RepID=UPI0003294884|nr:class I SAM-dependent methyltransferase [Actinoplanes sp. N902-109]AGL19692.1 methyltransferase [Actinoplanes sp. N902-109]